MRDLLTNPLCDPGDLGRPIPDSPHAVSVCLPRWADNVGYEEGEPRVVEAMQSGYPRFFFHPICRKFFAACREQFAGTDEDCLVFPSLRSAERFRQFFERHSGQPARIESHGTGDVQAVVFPASAAGTAKLGWQHSGGGISSRHAEAILEGRSVADASAEKQLIRQRVADAIGAAVDDVYLLPCGMNAIDTLHRAALRMFPERKSVQFGFPYVDSLKVLEKIGPGAEFFPRGNSDDLSRLAELLTTNPPAAVYTEFPSNPLLLSPDLEGIANLCRAAEVPLFADDTVASFLNVDILSTVDAVTSSLTKFFSGAGDVTGGSIVLNAAGPFYTDLKAALDAEYEDVVWPEDAVVLERNSRDYAERLPRINETASTIAAYLAARPEVAQVCYPELTDADRYDRFRKPAGGYGGLLSIILSDPANTAPRFFDALRVSKGPNLGTNYTLACPFTLLAHYNELDFAESCGVSRWLIRVSIGLEDVDDLIARFDAAL